MKVLTIKEAIEWLKATGSEDTLVMRKDSSSDPKRARLVQMYTFRAMLESKEESEEYPERLAIDYYGNTGWEVSSETLAIRAKGGTLIDKLVDECGHRIGGIYIEGGADVIDRYVGYAKAHDAVFILGLDKDIQQILPHLNDGAYCFLFEDESGIRMKYYYEQEYINMKADASYHIELFCDVSSMEVPVDAEKELYKRIAKIVNVYEKSQDCNRDENSTWESAVETVYEQIFREVYSEHADKALKAECGDYVLCSTIPYHFYKKSKCYSEDNTHFRFARDKWKEYLAARAELTDEQLTFTEHIKFFNWLAEHYE